MHPLALKLQPDSKPEEQQRSSEAQRNGVFRGAAADWDWLREAAAERREAAEELPSPSRTFTSLRPGQPEFTFLSLLGSKLFFFWHRRKLSVLIKVSDRSCSSGAHGLPARLHFLSFFGASCWKMQPVSNSAGAQQKPSAARRGDASRCRSRASWAARRAAPTTTRSLRNKERRQREEFQEFQEQWKRRTRAPGNKENKEKGEASMQLRFRVPEEERRKLLMGTKRSSDTGSKAGEEPRPAGASGKTAAPVGIWRAPAVGTW